MYIYLIHTSNENNCQDTTLILLRLQENPLIYIVRQYTYIYMCIYTHIYNPYVYSGRCNQSDQMGLLSLAVYTYTYTYTYTYICIYKYIHT